MALPSNWLSGYFVDQKQNTVVNGPTSIIIIIIIQIFKEESLSHSKVLFMRVLYSTNCSDLFKTFKTHN